MISRPVAVCAAILTWLSVVPAVAQVTLELPSSFVEERRGQLQFEIPEVYELASIIAFFANESALPDLMREDGPYVEAVRAHFSPFRGHPVVQAARFDETSLVRFVLFRDNAWRFCFRDYASITECRPVGPLWGAEDVFGPLVTLAADFAVVSGFRQFYHQHRGYYARLLRDYQEAIDLREIHSWLEQEFTTRVSAFEIAFSPLTTGTHATASFEDPDKDFKLAVMFQAPAPEGAADDPMQRFGVAQELFTEIDHHYVNPVSDRYAEEIDQIFDPEAWARGEIARQNYPTPRAVFNEYMTFAVFLLWARERYEPELYQRGKDAVIRQMEDRRGFFRFAEFNEAVFAAYEGRPESATVESIYPAVLAWMREQ